MMKRICIIYIYIEKLYILINLILFICKIISKKNYVVPIIIILFYELIKICKI